MLKRPSDGFWAGLVVGIILVTVMMYYDVDVNGVGKRPVAVQTVNPSVNAAESFVSTWQKMVFGTWKVDSTYVRTIAGEQRYNVAVRDVQSPPDYLDEAPSTITGSIGGRSYTCASVDNGKVTGCRDNGQAPPFEAYAQNRLVAVQQAVLGPDATYSVASESGNCFHVYLLPGKTANNWGDNARFCFDQATGAPTYTGLINGTSSDVTQSTAIAAPTPADLQISQLQK